MNDASPESRLRAALLECLADPALPFVVREAFVEYLSGGDPRSIDHWAEGVGFVSDPPPPWAHADNALFWSNYLAHTAHTLDGEPPEKKFLGYLDKFSEAKQKGEK